MTLVLYVGCALTEAPPEFRAEVAKLKEHLKTLKHPSGEPQFKVLEFLGLTAGNADDVYRIDIIENVGTCEIMLAICDYPSTGLGYELAVAAKERGVAVLGIAHADKRVTRLVLGIHSRHPHFTFERYNNLLEDVPRLLREKIEAEKRLILAEQPDNYPGSG